MREKTIKTKWDVIKKVLILQNDEIDNLKKEVKELKTFKQEMIQLLKEAKID